MMPVDMPNQPPVPVVLTQEAAFDKVKAALPNTEIARLVKSEMPGYYLVQLTNGGLAYLSDNGKYFILGVALNLETRKFLDNVLEGEIPSDDKPKE